MAPRILGRASANGLVHGSVTRLGDKRPLWPRRNADLAAELQQRAEQVEEARQEMILRGVEDRVVELDVREGEFADIGSGGVEGIERLAQCLQVCRCGSLSGACGSFDLDHATEFKQLKENVLHDTGVPACREEIGSKVIPLHVRRHPGLSTLAGVDEPEDPQMPNGLPDDWSADAELLGKPVFRRQFIAR